jgi:hypothetical protein
MNYAPQTHGTPPQQNKPRVDRFFPLDAALSYCSDRRKAFLTVYSSGWRQCEAVANRWDLHPKKFSSRHVARLAGFQVSIG